MNRLMCTGLCFLVILSGSVSAQEKWIEKTSYHFVVYYKDKGLEDFAKTVLEASEGYYDDIIDELGFRSYPGWTFDGRAKIYIYNDQQDYIDSARQSHWSSGAAYYASRTIRTYPSAAGFFDSLLPHELGHIIFHEFIGIQVKIPVWFDEGVAMYQEKAKRWGVHRQVRQAIEDGTFIPLPELSRMRPHADMSKEKINLFYAEAASIVLFLIREQGKFRFLTLCRKLQGGDDFYHAFELAYPHYKTLDRLNQTWVSFLKDQ